MGYRLVRHLLIHDPVGSATLSLTADFLFGSLVNWLLVWLVFYTIARDVDSPLTEPVWSHVTIAGIAVGYAIVWFRFYNPVGGFPPTVNALALSLFGMTLLSLSVFVLLTGSQLQSGVLTTTCFMLGYITALVTSLSPIPELLVGGWILWVVVQSLEMTDRKRRGLVSVDFEERVGTAAMQALRTEKGLYALIISLTGFLTALLPLFAIVTMFYVDFGGETPPLGWRPFLLVGLAVGLYSGYGMWYWLAMLRRLSAFLDHYEGRDFSVSHARPVAFFAPASLYLLGGGILVEFSSPSVALLAGLGAIAGVGWMLHSYSVYRTRQSSPQPVSADGHVICLAFIVQHLPLLLLGPDVLVALVLLPVLFYLPEIRDYGSALLTGGTIAFALVAFVGFHWIRLDWPPEVGPLLSHFVLPVVFALFVALVYSFDFESERTAGPASIQGVVTDLTRGNGVDRREFMTRGIGVVGLVGVGWLLFYHDSDEDEVRAVTGEFLVAMHDGDTETALALVHEDSPDAWLFQAREAELEIDDLVVAGIDDDVAEVWVEFRVIDAGTGDVEDREEAIELRRQDGEWLVYRVVTGKEGSPTDADGRPADDEREQNRIVGPWLVLDAAPEYNDDGEILGVEWTRTGGDPVEVSTLGALVRFADVRERIVIAPAGTLGDRTLAEGDSFRVDVENVDASEGDVLELFWSADDSDSRRQGPRYTFESQTTSGIRDPSIGDVLAVRYDAANTGYAATARGPAEAPTVQWSFRPGTASLSDPVVVDGAVSVASEEAVHTLDARLGTEQWAFETRGPTAPVVADGTVYVGSREGYIHALDTRDGTLRWSFETDGRPEFRPVVVADTAYALTGTSTRYRLSAIDAVDGTERWRTGTSEETATSLAATRETIYLVTEDEPVIGESRELQRHVVALDADDGTERWRFSTNEERLTPPVVENDAVYVVATDHSEGRSNLSALCVNDGRARWSHDLEGFVDAPPAVDDAAVYVGSLELLDGGASGRYCVSAVDAFDGSGRWSFEMDDDTFVESSPTVAGDTVYFGGTDWKLHALRTEDGSEQWSVEVGSLSSPVVVEGKVYVSGESRLYGLF